MSDADRDGVFSFTGVPRGSHRVDVRLVDGNGTALANPSSLTGVNLTLVNDPPKPRSGRYTISIGGTLVVPVAQGVLANDQDLEHDPLTARVVRTTGHGTLAPAANGSLTYNPAIGFAGVDSFAYVANDGFADSRVATNVIAVKGMDAGGAAALLAEVVQGTQRIDTGTSWKVSTAGPTGWQNPTFDDSAWVAARDFGAFGVSPWAKNVSGMPVDTPAHWIWSNDNNGTDIVFVRTTIIVAPVANN